MVLLQLLVNGIITGCALGVVAISFALVYSTTRIFHVAHAGIYTLGGYLAWTLVTHGVPGPLALIRAMCACAAVGALIQNQLYARLERRGATHLIMLIASLGALAVIQNIIAAIYSPDILNFPTAWPAGDRPRRPPPRPRADRHAGAQPRHLRCGDVAHPGHGPRQAHPRRRIQPLPRRDHPHAAPHRARLRHGHRLGRRVHRRRHGAARSRPAALWRRHLAAHRHHRHDRWRRRQPHRRLPALRRHRRAAEPRPARHARRVDHRHHLLHLRRLHAVPAAWPLRRRA